MSLEDSKDFCIRLYNALGRPRDSKEEDQAYMEVVAQRLETFTRSELTEAADRIMDTYTGKSRWPRLAELKNYCNQARTNLQARLQAERNPRTVASAAETTAYEPSAEALQFVELYARGKFAELQQMGLPVGHPSHHKLLRKWARDMVAKRRVREIMEGKR